MRIVLACSIYFVILKIGNAQNDIENSNLYQKKYENLNVDTILASPRLVTNYVGCLLNKKPCPPEGKELKRILPEALRTKCGRCWPSQKEGALKVITVLYTNYPQHYRALCDRWDPTGEYNRRFEEYLRDQKFNSIGGNDSEPGEQAQSSSINNIQVTQRPTRQGTTSKATPIIAMDEIPAISNRFGNDEEESTAAGGGTGYGYENPTTTTHKPKTPRPSTLTRRAHTQSSTKLSTSTPSINVESSTMPTRARPLVTIAPIAQDTPLPVVAKNSTAQSAAVPSNTNAPSQPVSVVLPALPVTTSTSTTTTTYYYVKTQNPVLNIINRITMKFANTADFIAGMFRVVPTNFQIS